MSSPRDAAIARAPVRVSFAGGGTDLAEYYESFGGLVVSSAITRYSYALAFRPPHPRITITSADYGTRQVFPAGLVPAVQDPLVLPKAAIEFFAEQGALPTGVDLYLASEVQPGTGLGSSSAMLVAIIHALSSYAGIRMRPRQAAELACRLEIVRLGMPIGKQDQYASAFGGLNAIEFHASRVSVRSLGLRPEQQQLLDRRLLLFSTGHSRRSRDILSEQRKASKSSPEVVESLHRLKGLARQMVSALVEIDLDGFGHLLHEAWGHKKSLSSKISSGEIDGWYEAARRSGALGGKITGAGGGGFLLLYCNEDREDSVREAMAAAGLRELPFGLEMDPPRLLGPADDLQRVSALFTGMGLPEITKPAAVPRRRQPERRYA